MSEARHCRRETCTHRRIPDQPRTHPGLPDAGRGGWVPDLCRSSFLGPSGSAIEILTGAVMGWRCPGGNGDRSPTRYPEVISVALRRLQRLKPIPSEGKLRLPPMRNSINLFKINLITLLSAYR